MKKIVGFIWGTLTRLGRILLWFVLLPVGLWRSIRHGRKKRDQRLIEEIRKEQER
jgi:hypothetical protein